MPPEDTQQQQSSYQPPVQERSPKKRSKLPVVILAVLFVLAAAAAIGYFTIRQQSEDKYTRPVTEVNTNTVKSLGFTEATLNDMQAVESSIDGLGADGEYDTATRQELADFRTEVQPHFDKYLENCTTYIDNYVHSTEVPADSEFPLLSDAKKQRLAEIRTMLAEQEDKGCQNTKAYIGLYYYVFDMSEGIVNSNIVMNTATKDDQALEALKKYADGNYVPKYKTEMVKAYGDDFNKVTGLMTDFFASTYDVGQVGMENLNLFSPEFSALMEAQTNLAAYDDNDIFDKYLEKESKRILDLNTRHYPAFKQISQESEADVKFSEPVYVGAIIHSALTSYELKDDYNLEAENTEEIVAKLKDGGYIKSDLPLSGITYKSTDSKNATLTITDPVENKSYKLNIVE